MVCADSLFSLKGKTTLLTGATGHLGQSIAFGLADAGAHVIVNGRNSRSTADLAERLINSGYSAEGLDFDVTDQKEIENRLAAVSMKPLHILVNNAYSGESGSIQTAESGQYRSSYEVSVIAAHNLFRTMLPALRLAVDQDGDASVINIASMYGLVSPDQRIYDSQKHSNPPFYGVAKAALIQWTRYAACEFGREGIRVNCISPGPFPTKSIQEDEPVFVSKLSSKVPMNRFGKPNELVGPVLFLLR